MFFFFFKQKTAYEMRISDWSSDVCSSDLSCRPTPDASRPRSAPGNYTPASTPSAAGTGSDMNPTLETIAASAFDNVYHIGHLVPDLLPAMYTQIGRASCRESVCQTV